MKTTRRTVLGWLLAACITPRELLPEPSWEAMPAFGNKTWREKALELFPEAEPPIWAMLRNGKKPGPGEPVPTFEWRMPNE